MQDFLDTDPASAGPPEKALSETIRDFEYFSMMCPGKLRGIQSEVEAVCDRLDYKGSPIYDEYPDRTAMEQLSQGIARRVSERLSEAEDSELYTAEIRFYSGRIITGNPAPQVCAMEADTPEKGTEEEPMGEAPDSGAGRLHTEALSSRRGQGGPGPSRPWGPPPPPAPPWGPPPPPAPPWGPPPPPAPPWGPPPPPPSRPGSHGNPDWGDVAALLLFSEIQRRRCRNRECR